MTQRSPPDDLPPGPWFAIHQKDREGEWWEVQSERGDCLTSCHRETIAREIAAIPEMREELKQATGECYRLGHLNIIYKAELARLSVEIETLRAQMHGMKDGSLVRDQNTELDRLRAEKAEMSEALEDLLNLKQGCHERAESILDRLTNETEGK